MGCAFEVALELVSVVALEGAFDFFWGVAGADLLEALPLVIFKRAAFQTA